MHDCIYNLYVHVLGGAVASWLVQSSLERAVWFQAQAGDIVLCSWAKHIYYYYTYFLSTSPHPGVYNGYWRIVGKPSNCGSVTCDGLASCPWRVKILPAASCYRNRDMPQQLSQSALRLHSHSLTCTCKCMTFNHCVLLIIIFSITLLLVQMSLYSVNKLKSTLPPSGLKPILLDSGWFGSFLYALHNVNQLYG